MIVGLHGKLGSGKDTVYERLHALDTRFVRMAFADKLKDSACALLGISREEMEELKRMEDYVSIKVSLPGAEHRPIPRTHNFTMRLFLQRYGTEAHRDMFGTNFWVDMAMAQVDEWPHIIQKQHLVPTFTDVRFPNEADAIRERYGEVWQVVGPDDDTGDHASEVPLPSAMVDRIIDNTVRDDEYKSLDEQLRTILSEMS